MILVSATQRFIGPARLYDAYTYGKPHHWAMSEDIHHLAGVGPICVFAVPLTLNNVALDPLSKDLAVSGLIDLGGSDSLLTGTASKKLRASVNPAARPSSEMTVNQTRLTMLTLYVVRC